MFTLINMAKFTKCSLYAWYLPVFLGTKNPWLVFRMKQKTSNNYFLYFHLWKKCLSYSFIVQKIAFAIS